MDLVLRRGLLVDGSGAAPVSADVGIERGRIAAIGDIPPVTDAEEVDLEGLVLAPGFIDIHTHYDAQVLWDPDLTPSCWHGVTTVVTGNCGFGIAPTRPEHRGTIARTLANVEGMSVEALDAGIDWSFESFPEYLDVVDRAQKRLNVMVMIGHTPVRIYVLGDEAAERPATPTEVDEMQALVAEAMQAGAAGFATSHSPTHMGDGGVPVPSRLATFDEIRALAGGVGRAGRGFVELTAGPDVFMEECADLARAIDRPVSWAALLAGWDGVKGPAPAGTAASLADRNAELSEAVWPQIACRPIVGQVNLAEPVQFAAVYPCFKEALAVPQSERRRLYADRSWRDRARQELTTGIAPRWWPVTKIQETATHPELRGLALLDVAVGLGADPFDLMVDLSIEDDLATRFQVTLINDDEDEIAQLLQHDQTLLGLSDAGAHASQLCDAGYATDLLGRWVRGKGALSLEKAVWRLTGHPASLLGLARRGLVRPGFAADLVAFDPATVGPVEPERVWDLPAGADRLIARSTGVHHVWVNGRAIRRDGVDVEGARPGVLIRGSEA